MSSASTAATLSSLSQIVETAASTIISLILAESCWALKAFGSIIISIWRLLFFKIIAEGSLASPLWPINLSLFFNDVSVSSFNIVKEPLSI